MEACCGSDVKFSGNQDFVSFDFFYGGFEVVGLLVGWLDGIASFYWYLIIRLIYLVSS